MEITATNVQLDSQHTALQRRETRESLRVWSNRESPGGRDEETRPERPTRPEVSISEAGKAAQLAETSAAADAEEAADADPKLALIRSLVEFFTGKKVKIFDARQFAEASRNAQSPAAPSGEGAATDQDAPAAFGVRYEQHTSYSEVERTEFTAKGSVRTADGRDIAFDLSLTMARSYYEESNVSLAFGAAAQRKDPLVLNFAGTAAALTDTRFSFDIDGDGSAERIASVAAGSGFLMIDRDGNGRATDGSELFGAATGNGFRELAALDDDANGWIDEGDAGFAQLRVWTRDGQGTDRLQTLDDLGIGAIALAHVETPFDLKTATNETLGQVRTSGVFLRETGGVGTVQQIDLTV
ncbi:MAG: VCBS repeat-containing protein [Azonexus sp.]